MALNGSGMIWRRGRAPEFNPVRVPCVFFAAWAKVNVTMPETVEVYLGDTAQILLQYRFDHNESNDFLIQWIVVSDV